MKNLNLLHFVLLTTILLTLSCCVSDSPLSDLDRDIIGEWVVDDYLLSGDNIVTNGEIQDMHMLFNDTYGIELSWFENGDFFVIDGSWNSNEDNATIFISLEEKVFFFCNDNDIEFNIFFFASDMELDTECNDNNWMEIQLERL